jgi:hypothetical protein
MEHRILNKDFFCGMGDSESEVVYRGLRSSFELSGDELRAYPRRLRSGGEDWSDDVLRLHWRALQRRGAEATLFMVVITSGKMRP